MIRDNFQSWILVIMVLEVVYDYEADPDLNIFPRVYVPGDTL